jgi:hypothetical protein
VVINVARLLSRQGQGEVGQGNIALSSTISHHPLITEQFRSLLAKGITGKRCKCHTLGIIVGEVRAIFEAFCLAQRVRLENMQSRKRMCKGDISY